jgi:hypothetical protein
MQTNGENSPNKKSLIPKVKIIVMQSTAKHLTPSQEHLNKNNAAHIHAIISKLDGK